MKAKILAVTLLLLCALPGCVVQQNRKAQQESLEYQESMAEMYSYSTHEFWGITMDHRFDSKMFSSLVTGKDELGFTRYTVKAPQKHKPYDMIQVTVNKNQNVIDIRATSFFDTAEEAQNHSRAFLFNKIAAKYPFFTMEDEGFVSYFVPYYTWISSHSAGLSAQKLKSIPKGRIVNSTDGYAPDKSEYMDSIRLWTDMTDNKKWVSVFHVTTKEMMEAGLSMGAPREKGQVF